MKTKVVRRKGYHDLIVDNGMTRPLVLMRISKGDLDIAWSVYDFRYSRHEEPHTTDIYNEVEVFYFKPEESKYQAELFDFPVTERENAWRWQRNDGMVLDGGDYPLDEQDRDHGNDPYSRIEEDAVWKFNGARQKLREAKEFWENFNGTWAESKITNPHLRPSQWFFTSKLRQLIERDALK